MGMLSIRRVFGKQAFPDALIGVELPVHNRHYVPLVTPRAGEHKCRYVWVEEKEGHPKVTLLSLVVSTVSGCGSARSQQWTDEEVVACGRDAVFVYVHIPTATEVFRVTRPELGRQVCASGTTRY